MEDLGKTIESLNERSKKLEGVINEAEATIEQATKDIEAARDRQVLARDGRAKIAVAKERLEEAQKAINELPKEENPEPEKNKKGNGKKIATAIGVIVLLSALAAGGYVLIKEARSGKIKDADSKGPDKSVSDGVLDDADARTGGYDSETNEFVVSDDGSILFDDDYEPLTTEAMETLVSEYAEKYNEEYADVITTKDIVKFAAIANIDVLSEDNKELASQLFGEQPKEEYLNDAAKLIGATVMYNFRQWNSILSTKNFIRVSDLIYGEQKDKMLEIEDYTDRIASAVNKNDAELVNAIVSEFLEDLSIGSLSKLDDGVGFAAQVSIAVIADGIAKDYLNQENFDMFQVLKTSEKYVSNIFRVYEECTNTENDVKTLTKTN